MNEDEIPGLNFIKAGRFPSAWKDSWTHAGGFARTLADPDYGYYLLMNDKAVVTQIFQTADFTAAQLEKAWYGLSFQYENYGDGSNSKVIIITGDGLEQPIDLSGKIPDKPMADWNYFPPYPLTNIIADYEIITIELHGSDLKESSGLRMTDVNIQLHIEPLKLSRLQVDEVPYEV